MSAASVCIDCDSNLSICESINEKWQPSAAIDVGRTGFEPATSALSRRRSKPAELTTHDLFWQNYTNWNVVQMLLDISSDKPI